MRTYKTTEIQDRLAATLAATEYAPGKTFAGSWWGRGDEAERFYFGDSAVIRKDGKPVRGIKVWLQFDDPATLDGAALRVSAPKRWYEETLAKWHAPAFAAALDLVDPASAAKFRAECEQHADAVGSMVSGEEDED